ncbi:MAG: hypothetical protein ONB43_24575 [candidate division KSB1 bacterium]|nr:hypothetical protein [candidate division KSB1 bacterium]MDZ7407022.1 hypothetical protein [candidate division KSB1 bacterium]
MKIEEVRKHLLRRPSRSFIIHLDNGKTPLITHPEVIIMEMVVVAVDEEGDAVCLAPEAICAIAYYKKTTLSKRNRARRTRTRKTS